MLAHRASYDKKTLARQVIPLSPGYRTALSSRPEKFNRCKDGHETIVSSSSTVNSLLATTSRKRPLCKQPFFSQFNNVSRALSGPRPLFIPKVDTFFVFCFRYGTVRHDQV